MGLEPTTLRLRESHTLGLSRSVWTGLSRSVWIGGSKTMCGAYLLHVSVFVLSLAILDNLGNDALRCCGKKERRGGYRTYKCCSAVFCVRGVFVVCTWCVRGVYVVCMWCVRFFLFFSTTLYCTQKNNKAPILIVQGMAHAW